MQKIEREYHNLAADYLAVGPESKASIIFSTIPNRTTSKLKWTSEHPDASRELLRMTAFKEKILQSLKPEDQEKILKQIRGSDRGIKLRLGRISHTHGCRYF